MSFSAHIAHFAVARSFRSRESNLYTFSLQIFFLSRNEFQSSFYVEMRKEVLPLKVEMYSSESTNFFIVHIDFFHVRNSRAQYVFVKNCMTIRVSQLLDF